MPSLRLKALRDGEEDYELLGLARNAGLSAQVDRIASGVASGWDTWSRDPAVLERARRQIGNLLDATVRSS